MTETAQWLTGTDLLNEFAEGQRLITEIESYEAGAKIAHRSAFSEFLTSGRPTELNGDIIENCGQMLHLEDLAAQRIESLWEVAERAAQYVGVHVSITRLDINDFPMTEFYHSTGMSGTGLWEAKSASPERNPQHVTGKIIGVWVAANTMRVCPARKLSNISRTLNEAHFDIQMVDSRRQPRVDVKISGRPVEKQAEPATVRSSIDRTAPARRPKTRARY